jgi:ribosomal subunit interface protein
MNPAKGKDNTTRNKNPATKTRIKIMNTNLTRTPQTNLPAPGNLKISTWREESMDILIHSKGVKLTGELRAAINQKIGRVRRYAPRAMRARVRLHEIHANEPQQVRARVHFEIPGNDVVAEHTDQGPLAALDLVVDKIERRLRKRKTARLAKRVRAVRSNPSADTRRQPFE